jgi:hypothetical protein
MKMKISFYSALFSIFISPMCALSALACPNLTGIYRLHTDAGDARLVIKQKVCDAVEIDSESHGKDQSVKEQLVVQPDGVSREIEKHGTQGKAILTAQFIGEALVCKYQWVENQTVTYEKYELDDQGNLEIEDRMTAPEESGPFTVTAKRLR